MASIPHFNIKISSEGTPENREEFKDLLNKLRPNWIYEDIITSRLTAGFVNCLIGVHHKDDVTKGDHVLVRINNDGHKSLINFNDEITGLLLCSKHGYTPKSIATFTNGFVQDLIEIEEQTFFNMFKEPNCRSIGKLLAKVHSLKDEFESKEGISHGIISFRKVHHVITYIPDDEDKIPEVPRALLKAENITKKWLENEIGLLEKYFDKRNMKIVLGHGAFHLLNILIQKSDEGKIYLVDFDGCGLEHEATDFAFFKCVNHFFNIIDILDEWKPSDNDFRRLLRHYLRARNEINTGTETEPSEEEVEEFYQNVLKLYPVVTLYLLTVVTTELIDLKVKLTQEQASRVLHAYKDIYLQVRHHVIPEGI